MIFPADIGLSVKWQILSLRSDVFILRACVCVCVCARVRVCGCEVSINGVFMQALNLILCMGLEPSVSIRDFKFLF